MADGFDAGTFIQTPGFATPGQVRFNQELAMKLAEGSMNAPVGESGNVKAVSPFAPLAMMANALAGRSLSNLAGSQEREGRQARATDLAASMLPGDPSGRMGGGAMAPLSPLSPLGGGGGAIGYAEALKPGESNGNYHAIGPTTSDGDHAFGAYQVKGQNVGPWTKKWLGVEMTPQQFLANPQAQDHVARMQMQEYVSKYGPEGAGRAWYGGEGNVANPNARDPANPHAPSVGEYGRRYMAQLGSQQGSQQALAFSGEPVGEGTPGGGVSPMVSALSGRAGPVTGGGGMPVTGSSDMPLGVLPQRQMVPRQQMYNLINNPWVDPAELQYFENSFFGQYQPQAIKTPEGTLYYNQATGQHWTVPDIKEGNIKIEGAGEFPYRGVYRADPSAPGGYRFVPIGGNKAAPAPAAGGPRPYDLSDPKAGKPSSTSEPPGSAAPSPATGKPEFGAAPTPYLGGPGGGPRKAAPAAAPAKALPFSGEPQAPGAEEAPPEITEGPEKAKAEKAGGMLTTPPPAVGKPMAYDEAPGAPEALPASQTPDDVSGMSIPEMVEWGRQNQLRREFGNKDIEKFHDTFQKLQDSARTSYETQNSLQLVKPLLTDPRFLGGPGSDIKMAWNKALTFLGDKAAEARVATTQAVEKLKSSQVLIEMRSKLQGLGQVRLAEIALLNDAMYSRHNTVGANQAIVQVFERAQSQMQELAKVSQWYAEGYRWNSDGKLITDKNGNPIRSSNVPTSAGHDQALLMYLEHHPLFSAEDIKKYRNWFAPTAQMRAQLELDKRVGMRKEAEAAAKAEAKPAEK